MTKDFSEIMAQRSDKELAEILTTKREDYQADAINAAQVEFDKRDLDVNSYVTVEEMKAVEKAKEPIPNEDKKFNWLHKFFTFFSLGYITYFVKIIATYILEMPFLIILSVPITIIVQVILYKEFKKKGFDTLALNLKNWSLNGWIFYAGIAVLVYLLDTIMRHV
jgi:hypothetical protein